METTNELCKYCLMDTPVRYCKVHSHIEMRKPELCAYCQDTPVAQCEVQDHWEKRLRSSNLPEDSTVQNPPRQFIETRVEGEVIREERLVPLTGRHEVMQIADLKSLPEGWHSATSGDVQSRFSNTSYRNINVYERSPSPKYNSAGFQIEASC